MAKNVKIKFILTSNIRLKVHTIGYPNMLSGKL